MKKDTKIAIVLIVLAILIVVIPPFALKGAEFGGSDDAGSQKIEEIAGDYEPWFTPVFETALNGEIPGEIESLLFCVQTAIGVGIIAFLMGRMVERMEPGAGYGAGGRTGRLTGGIKMAVFIL